MKEGYIGSFAAGLIIVFAAPRFTVTLTGTGNPLFKEKESIELKLVY